MNDMTKAVEEMAKTAGKAIDAANRVGQFIAEYIKGSLEQGFGIFEDKLRYIRWERRMRLMDRATQFLHARGLKHPTRPVPMNIAIPILQLGSMEEDDELQDLWARLLVNAGDAGSGITVQAAFLGILQNLSPFDARVLEQIYSFDDETGPERKDIYTMDLPEKIHLSRPDPPNHLTPSREVEVSLGNLGRLGLIQSNMAWGGKTTFHCICHTFLGQEFMKACRNPVDGQHS